LETLVDEEFLLANLQRSSRWAENDDAPSVEECTEIGIQDGTQWDIGVYESHIFVSKSQLCAEVCAGHTTMITIEKFARVAAEWVGEQIRERIEVGE
jgi:hypothetical protein